MEIKTIKNNKNWRDVVDTVNLLIDEGKNEELASFLEKSSPIKNGLLKGRGYYFLFKAVNNNSVEAVKILNKNNIRIEYDIKKISENDYMFEGDLSAISSLLRHAIRNKNIDMVDVLVDIFKLDLPFCEKRLSDSDKYFHENEMRVKPLLFAIQANDEKIIEKTMSFSYIKGGNSSALYEAIMLGNIMAVDMLFDFSDVEKMDDEMAFMYELGDTNEAGKAYMHFQEKLKKYESDKTKNYLQGNINSFDKKRKAIKII